MLKSIRSFLSALWWTIENVPEAEVKYGIRKMRAETDHYRRYSN